MNKLSPPEIMSTLNCISLLIIAICLIVLVVKTPQQITYNDLKKNPSNLRDIPLSIIHKGNITVDGNVDSNVNGSIDIYR